MRSLIFCLCLPLAAQTFPLLINAGGPAVGTYVADELFAGGATWGPSNDPTMSMASGEFQTLRYSTPTTVGQPGAPFSYNIPVTANGVYSVSLLMLEPNKTGPNQRVFTVTVNGQTTGPLDLFALTGGKLIPYEVNFLMFAPERQITISFRASVGNAVVSAIIIRGGGQSVAAAAATWAVWSEEWVGLFYRDSTDGILKIINAAGHTIVLAPMSQATATAEQQRYLTALSMAIGKAQGAP